MPLRAAFACLLGLMLAGCSQDRAKVLKIGMNAWPGYQLLTLAQREGCFAAHGIEAQLVELESLHDLVAAFEAGLIDVMPGTFAEALAVLHGGKRKPEVIYVTDASEGADVVQARAGIASPADLRGKRIAYEAGALGSYMLSRMLELYRIDAAEVECVSMHQVRMEAAMAEGTVDAVITYPPTTATVAALPGVKTIFSSVELPGEILDVLVVDRAHLDADPNFLPSFYAALADAQRIAAERPSHARATMARACGLEPSQWAEATKDIRFYRPEHQHDLLWSGQLQRVIDHVDRLLHPQGEQSCVDKHELLPAARRPSPLPNLAAPR